MLFAIKKLAGCIDPFTSQSRSHCMYSTNLGSLSTVVIISFSHISLSLEKSQVENSPFLCFCRNGRWFKMVGSFFYMLQFLHIFWFSFPSSPLVYIIQSFLEDAGLSLNSILYQKRYQSKQTDLLSSSSNFSPPSQRSCHCNNIVLLY